MSWAEIRSIEKSLDAMPDDEYESLMERASNQALLEYMREKMISSGFERKLSGRKWLKIKGA